MVKRKPNHPRDDNTKRRVAKKRRRVKRNNANWHRLMLEVPNIPDVSVP